MRSAPLSKDIGAIMKKFIKKHENEQKIRCSFEQ